MKKRLRLAHLKKKVHFSDRFSNLGVEWKIVFRIIRDDLVAVAERLELEVVLVDIIPMALVTLQVRDES